ncbi:MULTISPECIES: HNH endonuclease [Enorma]|uniref:HNH endonuclease n=1 Tax=Enorma TaxID=1472762 RepID=UPI0016529F72|nr:MULTISPECIES: HNH endonuclease [Enorma]
MTAGKSRNYIERKLYVTAAREWCHERASANKDVSYDGSQDEGDHLVRCLVRPLGWLDIQVGFDGVVAACGDEASAIANYSSERFDQLEFQARLDAFLAGILSGNFQSVVQHELREGSSCEVTLDRYERSEVARKACIAAHGATCAICGFDFSHTYGAAFAGIIQVHHIVPLHVIGEEHEVDPVRDLIPVCPNCHVALHSKPGGTYLPDELRALMQ